jgi:hypothetical protein
MAQANDEEVFDRSMLIKTERGAGHVLATAVEVL